MLTDQNVSFKGRWYECEGLTIYPRLVQPRLPVWTASAERETVARAGRRGFGLMAGHAWSPALIGELRDIYREASGGGDPDIVILRNVCVADTDAAAQNAALPALERFSERMREHSGRPPSPMSRDAALAAAIVGSPETCRAKLAELSAAVPVASLVLKIACLDPALAEETLRRFRHEVAPAQADVESVAARC